MAAAGPSPPARRSACSAAPSSPHPPMAMATAMRPGPGYYEPAYYAPACFWQKQRWYDAYGYAHVRKVRVCN